MGSLMAGWNSPVLSSKKARLERNTSLTKDEIDQYWKTKREAEEEHLKAATDLALEIKAQSSRDVSTEIKQDETLIAAVEEDIDKLSNYKDWWTKSTWAFLNEPAMKRMERADYRYVTQYDVATKAAEVNN